jgi:hypothetical protein
LNPSSLFGTYGHANFQVLWEDGERVFCRGVNPATPHRSAVLAMFPAGSIQHLPTLNRFAHEYFLKDELDGAWTAKPLELICEGGRTTLVLEDPGGEPLDRLVGAPMEVRSFLRLAIAAALTRSTTATLSRRTSNPPISLSTGRPSSAAMFSSKIVALWTGRRKCDIR